MTTPANDRYRVPGRRLNLTDVFLDRQLREGRADRTCLIVDHPTEGIGRHSYAQVAALANRYGHELSARGLGLEDRIFLILEDGLPWVAAFFGALKIGCTTMFLNPQASDEELAFYLEDSRCKGVVTTAAIAARLPTERPFLRTVLVVDDAPTQAAIAARPSELLAAPTYEEDFAIWLYSSGSTGTPKAAVHPAKARKNSIVIRRERFIYHLIRINDQQVINSNYTTPPSSQPPLFSRKPRPGRQKQPPVSGLPQHSAALQARTTHPANKGRKPVEELRSRSGHRRPAPPPATGRAWCAPCLLPAGFQKNDTAPASAYRHR